MEVEEEFEAEPMETGEGNEESPPPKEHSYCKLQLFQDNLETAEPPQAAADTLACTSPKLTSLDKMQDNFESLLLLLLQAYTTQNCPGNPSILGGAPISGEALDTLSPQQITALITSNSVNYEVIQQILAQQKVRGKEGARLQSPIQEQNRALTLNLSEEPQGDAATGSSPLCSPLLTPLAPDAGQQLQQLVQITPQQLKLLQTQVNELLLSQHVTLPSDLSPEQQQQLIQTLLLRQLQVQQSGVGESISVKDASVSMNKLLASKVPGLGAGHPTKAAVTTAASVKKALEAGKSGSTSEGGGKGRAAKAAEGKAAKGTQSKQDTKPASLSGMAISAATQRVRKTVAARNSGKGGGAKSPGTGRKKKEISSALLGNSDPTKPPLPYNLFFSEVYSTVMATNPKMGFTDSSRIISTMWTAMGTDVKKRYYDEHDKLKAQYEAENASKADSVGASGSGDKYTSLKSLIAGSSSEPTTPVEKNPVMANEEDIVVAQPTDIVLVENERVPVRTNTKNISFLGQVAVESVSIADLDGTEKGKDPKLCVNQDCKNIAVFVKDRGPKYCSNECVVRHCKTVFDLYFAGGKVQQHV